MINSYSTDRVCSVCKDRIQHTVFRKFKRHDTPSYSCKNNSVVFS